MRCPGCDSPMTSQTLEGHTSAALDIDVCYSCQAFWFDRHESLQLSPASTLKLFRAIGDRAGERRGPVAATAKCPRCRSHLVPTHDAQRNVRFQYARCPHGHGRLTTFFDFLREKHFIRPMSAAQIAELRQHVQTVNCSNCGGPIDLAQRSDCAHCGSALSMLDLTHARDLVVQLQQADRAGRPVDPALPMRLEQARREVETAFAGFEREPRWFEGVSTSGPVGAGLISLARWLKGRV